MRHVRLLPLLCALASANPPFTPADLLPPAPEWHGASEKLIVPPDHPWITPTEKTGFTHSPTNVDTHYYLQRLCEATPLLKLQVFGSTALGHGLYMVVASREDSPTPEKLSRSGKPTLLAQAGIHSGEIDGKDAGLMLLRDIAFGDKAHLLDKANFIFVPVFNADGHERASEWNRPNQRGPVRQGWRTTAQNLNLNRDYMKADAPEMQAMLRLINEWKPSLYLDLHVTDGIDYQYDITYGFHGWDGTPAWSPQGAAWLDQIWRPAVDAALAAAGHIPGPLVFAENNRDLTKGIGLGPGDPRFSNAYGDLRGIPSVLVENHSLKPYKQRVLGTYVLIEASLKTLGDHASAVQKAIADDAAARPATLPVNWTTNPEATTKMDFKGVAYEEYVSPASGAKEVRWLGTPKLYKDLPVHWSTKPGAVLQRPKAYIVPSTKKEVIARLDLHGIQSLIRTGTIGRIVGSPMQSWFGPGETYQIVDPKPAAQPFEGRYQMTAKIVRVQHAELIPATGGILVPTDQPLGNLAMALLEPECNDSLFAWGFFPEILQRTEYIEGYVVAPMAEKMLAADPKLKAEFEAKLAADPKFAADPQARLQWFYERSRFYDDRYLLYPIGIER